MARLNPYINFRDSARAALDFYHGVFGGELHTTAYSEFGVGEASEADKIMHGQLDTAKGFTLMIADVPDSMPFEPGSAISVSISGAADEAELLQGYWDALAEGATIVEELTQAPWGDSFGMLVDRFGIHWMVNLQGPQAA